MLRAGFAQTDITPPLSVPYLGFLPRQAFFTGVHDRLYARALALETRDGGAVIIAADAIGFDNRILGPGRDFTAEVRARVAARTGVAPAQVMVACTHAHSTPETINFRRLLDHPGIDEWLERLMAQLTATAAAAWASRRARQLRHGSVELRGLSNPRRAPVRARHLGLPEEEVRRDYPLDRRLRVLLLTDPDSGRSLVLGHFASHPVTVQVQELISADFPGLALRIVRRALPDCDGALFLQGCDGDVNPPRVTTDFADVERYGRILGGGMVEAAGLIAGECAADPEPVLASARRVVALPSRPLPAPEEIDAQIADCEARLAGAGDDGERTRLGNERRMLEERRVRVSWGDGPVPVEVQALRLGEVAIVGLAGEPLMALNLAIQEGSPAALTLVAGYANGYCGYLAPPEAWEEGGYEVSLGPWSHAGPEAGPLLVGAARELLGELWA